MRSSKISLKSSRRGWVKIQRATLLEPKCPKIPDQSWLFPPFNRSCSKIKARLINSTCPSSFVLNAQVFAALSTLLLEISTLPNWQEVHVSVDQCTPPSLKTVPMQWWTRHPVYHCQLSINVTGQGIFITPRVSSSAWPCFNIDIYGELYPCKLAGM